MSQQSQIEYPTDLRAPGAIDQLIAFHHQTFGDARMEDNSDGGDGGQGGDGGNGGGNSDGGQGGGDNDGGTGGNNDGGDDGKDLGYPKDTPVAEMTLEQRAAYWEHHSKKHEARARGLSKLTGGKTAEQIKAEQEELEALRRGKRSDTENAIEDAKKQGRNEALAETRDQLVTAKFEAALSHVDEDRRDQIIAGLNLKAYITEDGKVDTDKVKTYAATIAPVDTTTHRRRDRNWGAGHRDEGKKPAGAAGRAEAERRFGKTKSTTDA